MLVLFSAPISATVCMERNRSLWPLLETGEAACADGRWPITRSPMAHHSTLGSGQVPLVLTIVVRSAPPPLAKNARILVGRRRSVRAMSRLDSLRRHRLHSASSSSVGNPKGVSPVRDRLREVLR
jgi:hypothetical protein